MVKNVFKVLISVPIIIVVISIIVEMVNMSISSQQLKRDIHMSLNGACESFTQESFRSKALNDIYTEDGTMYMSGKVYRSDIDNSTSEDAVYSYFYNYGYGYSNYFNWLNNRGIIENKSESFSEIYDDVRLVNIGLRSLKGENTGASDTDRLLGEAKVSSLYTPMNTGIPYIGLKDGSDRAYQAVEKLFKWNTARILSQCNKDNIIKDDNGRYCVNYNSWRVYVDTAKIESIQYFVFDTQSGSDRSAMYDMISLGESRYVDTSSDNRYITVVKVGYSIDVGYVGVTPFGNIYNYTKRNSGSSAMNDYNYVVQTIKSSETDDYVYFYNVD